MLLKHIDDAKATVKPFAESEDRDKLVPSENHEWLVRGNIVHAQSLAVELNLEATHNRVWEGGGDFYLIASHITWQQLWNELTVLRQAIEADLEKHLFVQIPPQKVRLIEHMTADWGKICNSIPDADVKNVKTDVEEAVNSYVFERNTASVFHSMRVAERGLRIVARKLHVKLTDNGKPKPIERAAWGEVVGQIQNKIKIERQKPKGKAQALRLQRLAEAGDHCEYMKDLWRNEVSHAGKFYNEGEALGVLNRVRDFMLFLANGAKAKS